MGEFPQKRGARGVGVRLCVTGTIHQIPRALALNLFNHTFYETNFKPKLFTAKVECNGTVLKEPKTEKAILFKFSFNDGDLVFWFTFNLAVHFRPKMALALDILSD